MSKPLPLLILLLLPLMMMRVTPGATRSYTGCSAVTMDKETTVVCHFEEDIGQSGRGFNVQFFYPNHLEDPASEVVLMCNRRKSGGLVCRTSSDVNFDEHQAITDRLVLTRPASKDKEGGEYLCQAVPALPGPIRHCILTYIETPKQPTPSPTIPPTTEKDEDERVLPLLTVIFVFVFLIFLLFGVTLVVVIYLKRKRIRQWWTGHAKKRDVEDQAEPDQLESPSTYIPQDKPDHTGLSPQVSPPTHTSQGQPSYIVRLPYNTNRSEDSHLGGTPVDAQTTRTGGNPPYEDPQGQQGRNHQQQKKDQPRQRGGKEQQEMRRPEEPPRQRERMEQQQQERRQQVQRPPGGERPKVEKAIEADEAMGATAADPLMTKAAITKNSPGSVAADQGEHWFDAQTSLSTEPLTKAQRKKAEQEQNRKAKEEKEAKKKAENEEKKAKKKAEKEEKAAKQKAEKEEKDAKNKQTKGKGEGDKKEDVSLLPTKQGKGFSTTRL